MIGGVIEQVKRLFKDVRDVPDHNVKDGLPPPSIAVMNGFFNEYQFADLLNYKYFDPVTRLYFNEMGAPFLNKGQPASSYGFTLEIAGSAGASDEMARVLLGMFNQQFVTGTTIQVSTVASPEISSALAKWIGTRKKDSIYERMALKRAEYWLKGTKQSLFKDNIYLLRNFRVFVSVMMPGTADASDITTALGLRDGMGSVFRAAGFPSVVVEPDRLINILDELVNPRPVGEYKTDPVPYDASRPINEQIVAPDNNLLVGKDGLVLGGHTSVRCLSVKDYPKRWALAQSVDLIGDFFQETLQFPVPFINTLVIQIADYEATKRSVSLKSARAVQVAESPMAKFMPEKKKIAEEWRQAQEDVDSGIMLVKAWHGVTIFAPLGMGDQAENQVKSLFASKGWALASDRFLQVQSFIFCLPGRADPHYFEDMKAYKRVRTMSQFNAINTMPVVTEWQGNGAPLLFLSGRRGQVMYVDPFANDQGNYNCAVVAASGAGKSFFLNEMACAVVGTGGRAWIIDVGRSYEKTCKILGGQFIEFSERAGIKINPFSAITDFDDDEVTMLKQIVAQAASTSAVLDDLSMSWIEQAIKYVWEQKRNDATFTDIAEYLIELGTKQEDKRASDLGQILFPFTKDGVYGNFFEGKATLHFESDLTVLELEELKSKQGLQEVVLLILMLRIQQEMYLGQRNRRKVCIIDEAWDLMNGGQAAKFIETGYRRVRKYGGAFMTATQSVNDYYRNGAAQAAWENSDFVFMLRQKEDSIEQLKRTGRFMVDEWMGRLLRSIKTRQGEYSEVYIHMPGGGAIARLIVDNYTAKIYSTKAEDVNAVNQLVAQGYSVADAIDKLIEGTGK